MYDFLRESATLAELGGALAKLLVERDERRIVLVDRLHLFHRHHDGAQKAFGVVELERRSALFALQQELDAAQAALDLSDAGDDAHGVQDVRRGLVGVVALGDGKDESLTLEGGFDGSEGPGSAGGDGRREAGEDDRPSQG